MRHDGGADDADGDQQRVGVGNFRLEKRMNKRRRPVDMGNEHLDQIAKCDDAATRPPMISSTGAEAARLEHQDGIGDDCG